MFETPIAEAAADDHDHHDGYAAPRRPSPPPAAEAAFQPSRYAPAGNRGLIWLIVAAHLAAIWAIAQFDAYHRPHRAQRLQVELVPVDVAPPPRMAPPPEMPEVKVRTPIVAPPPIVQPTIAAPPSVQSTPAPTPPAPPARPTLPAPPAPVMAAPIVPPDGMAANLGNPAPSYPMMSRRLHEEGVVRLRVRISATGAVEEVTIAKSSGFDRLDDAALQAVRKWRFRPGTQAGVPIEAVGTLAIPFRLT